MQFRRISGYPQGRSGYQIDHFIPLGCARSKSEHALLDQPWNMHWMRLTDKRSKDRWEPGVCKIWYAIGDKQAVK